MKTVYLFIITGQAAQLMCPEKKITKKLQVGKVATMIS